MIQAILKRDGRKAEYDLNKITAAITKAMSACGRNDAEENQRLANIVDRMVNANYTNHNPSVEDIQDLAQTWPSISELK